MRALQQGPSLGRRRPVGDSAAAYAASVRVKSVVGFLRLAIVAVYPILMTDEWWQLATRPERHIMP